MKKLSIFLVFCLVIMTGFFSFSQQAHAAIAVVNNEMAYTLVSGGTSLCTVAVNVTAGNLLVVTAQGSAAVATSISDTAGNTFTSAISDNTYNKVSMWYAKNVTGNASDIICANWASSDNFDGVSVVQYSGVDTTSPLDAAVASSTPANTFTTIKSGTFTTTSANEVIVNSVASENQRLFTAGSGYTREQGTSTATYLNTQDIIVSAIQTGVTSDWGQGTGDQYQVLVATFKQASAAAGAPTGHTKVTMPVGKLNIVNSKVIIP